MNPKLFTQLSALSPQAQQRRLQLLNCIKNTREMFDALEQDMTQPENCTENAFQGDEWQNMVALTIRIALTELALLTKAGTDNAEFRHPKNPPGAKPEEPGRNPG